jgi:hypothetical protein
VRKLVSREGVHERVVHALGLEDVQHFTQIRGLLVFVANVFPFQPHGTRAFPRDDRAFDQRIAGTVGRAALRGTPKFGDRDGLTLCATCATKARMLARKLAAVAFVRQAASVELMSNGAQSTPSSGSDA